MTLVALRCKVRGCGKLLSEVVSAPADSDDLRWSSYVWIPVCPRHGGARGSVAKWVAKRRRLDLPHDRYTVGRWICWEELQPAVQLARRTGRTQVHRL
jgi:hypothetical protein